MGAMAPKPKEGKTPPAPLMFGVDEGAEIGIDDPGWVSMNLPVGTVLEVAVHGSSLGLGLQDEQWFAMSVDHVTGDHLAGRQVVGRYMGSDGDAYVDEIMALLEEGAVHLCLGDPCLVEAQVIHVNRVRLWAPQTFRAGYLTVPGKALLKDLVAQQKKSTREAPPRKSALRPTGDGRKRPPKEGKGGKPPVISVPSDEEAPHLAGDQDPPSGTPVKDLRATLGKMKERILSRGAGEARARHERDANTGPGPDVSRSAVPRSGLVAGTSLNPAVQTPLALTRTAASSDTGTGALIKKLAGKSDAASALLAQAVQTSAHEARVRKEKRKDREKGDMLTQLVDLLKGKKKKKRRKHKGNRAHQEREGDWIKPDPDPSSSGSGGSSSSSSGGRGRKRPLSDSDSELSFEPPLRKRAMKEPGSVMQMLVKHAQLQLDRGSLLESEGAEPSVISGVKISTYFALLIRPYHAAGSPLLRELYALASAIDLLRMGKLPETADALASRFVAVHTALAEGSWSTASQLELYPLEPVQSANTATMLEAQKHRRLVLKSQGLPVSGRWWGNYTGKGKAGGGAERTQKGELKGRGKGKGKGGNKTQNWNANKGQPNPWAENKEEPPKK